MSRQHPRDLLKRIIDENPRKNEAQIRKLFLEGVKNADPDDREHYERVIAREIFDDLYESLFTRRLS